MKKYNLWWLKQQNVLGKVVSLPNGEKGFWCKSCGEVNQITNFDTQEQKCKYCKIINVIDIFY